MIPFPGESVGCVDAYTVTRGWFLSNDIELREKRVGAAGNGHYVINDGDEWRMWAYCVSDWAYLEAGDTTPLTVSWVIEVLSGTGTLEFRDQHDAAWDYDEGATLPNDLGIVNVVGAATYVVDTTTFPDNDDLVAILNGGTGPANLGIVCTSGSVDIQQVKLRVWPTSGPLGGWSADTVTEDAHTVTPGFWNQPGNVIEPEPTWVDLGELHASVDDGLTGTVDPIFSGTSLGEAAFTAQHTEYPPEVASNIYQYGAHANFIYYRLGTPRLSGPDVDFIRPPTEVQDEADFYLFQMDGPGNIEWTQDVVTWVMSSSTPSPTPEYWYADGAFQLSQIEMDDFLASGTSMLPYLGTGSPVASFPTLGPASPDAYDIQSFHMIADPQPNQLYMMVTWHEGMLDYVNEIWDGTMAGGSSVVDVHRGDWFSTYPEDTPVLLAAEWIPEAYRYWDPFGGAPEPEGDFLPAGYFLRSLPDLSGLGDGVDVNFA